MHARVEVIGVYPVNAPEPCHLIELWVRGSEMPIEMGAFTQEEPGEPCGNWQVPYDEKIMDAAGSGVVADPWEIGDEESEVWKGDVRLAFFFHYLRIDAPLRTPFGSVPLPVPTQMPARLQFMKYGPPA